MARDGEESAARSSTPNTSGAAPTRPRDAAFNFEAGVQAGHHGVHRARRRQCARGGGRQKEAKAAAAAQLLALLCDEYTPPHIAGAEALPVELEDGELEEGEL